MDTPTRHPPLWTRVLTEGRGMLWAVLVGATAGGIAGVGVVSAILLVTVPATRDLVADTRAIL